MSISSAPTAVSVTPDDPDMGCAEALLAGTLALMTGHAQACCDAHRETMARKIAVRLQALARHEAFSPHFHTAVGNLQALWLRQGGLDGLVTAQTAPVPATPAHLVAAAAARTRRELWHATPEALQ